MNPSTEVTKNMTVLYYGDGSTLLGAARVGKAAGRVATLLSLMTDAAEKDARRKLKKVRLGVTPSQAWLRAWMVTRYLRVSTALLRQVSAQATAYQVELKNQFVVPAEKNKSRTKGSGGKTTSSGDFNILGGI